MKEQLIAWYVIPILFFLLFLFLYKVNRTKLTAGLALSCSLISFAGIFLLQAYLSDNSALRAILALVLFPVVLLMAFGVYIFIAFLVLNTRSILRKEKRDIKHILTLLLAIGLILIIIISRSVDYAALPRIAQYFFYSVYGLIVYYFLHLTQFIISIILCNCSRPKKDQRYIIVLGCWITDGRVTPLLARRIDKAIDFYTKQKELCPPPKLILSGGKGSDETCSEAEAMKIYALEKGIPEQHLLLETKSVSTLENMKFSKEIMEMDSGGEPYRCIYATNNYHVLRAGIFARKARLKIDGIGAKTAFYYLPNAILREYIAYLYIHWRWNIVFTMCSLIFGSIILPIIIQTVFQT